MSTSHHSHQHVLFFFQKSLRNLFWSSFLRQSGFSLVDIFTFVYFYRLGIANNFFSWFQLSNFQQGILTVVADVLILRFIELLVIFPMAQWASKLGLPKAAIVGNFLMALRYGLLALSAKYPLLIFTAAIIQGIELSVFSPAYDTMFAKRASNSKVGRDVGAFTFILKLSYSLLPALAGGLIVTFGFGAAFFGAMIFFLLSNVPLFPMHWKETLTSPNLSHFLSWCKRSADFRVHAALVGRYVNDVGFELWPIYLILVFGKVERLGFLMSLSFFISLILVYFTGWYIDHSKRNMLFIVGGLLLSLFWILRINMTLITMIIAIEIAQKLVESFFYPSFDALVYRISKRLDTFVFHVYKEVLTCIVSLIFWSVLGILFILYGAIWNWIFIFAAGGILVSTLLYTARYERS
ncbi:MAG: MFS transporter [Candidatus Woesebacteria bacterium]